MDSNLCSAFTFGRLRKVLSKVSMAILWLDLFQLCQILDLTQEDKYLLNFGKSLSGMYGLLFKLFSATAVLLQCPYLCFQQKWGYSPSLYKLQQFWV